MRTSKRKQSIGSIYPAIVICITTFFLFADQNLIAPNLTMIAREYGFSDIEKDEKLGGEVAMGFFLIGGLISLVAGYLTDISNRIQLYFAVVTLGEMSCIYAYYSKTFEELYYARILTGISIGGAAPIIYSLLADYYPSSMRIYVGMVVSISVNLGSAGGQVMSSYMAPLYGWRTPFLFVAIPAMLSAFVLLLTVKEPVRGSKDYVNINGDDKGEDDAIRAEHTLETIDFHKCSRLFQRPTLILALIQGIPGCVPWGVIGTYLNDYLTYDINFTSIEAAYVITALGTGIIIGQIIGGIAGQMLYNRSPPLQCLLMGASTALGAAPMLYVINIEKVPSFFFGADSWQSKANMHFSIIFASFLTGAIAAITGPNIRSLLQNVSPPELRGTVFSFFNLTDDLGKGGGPYLIAKLTEAFGSRRLSFTVGISCWILCGFFLALMSFTIRSDEAAVRTRWLSGSRTKIKEDASASEDEERNPEKFPLLSNINNNKSDTNKNQTSSSSLMMTDMLR